MDPNAVWRAYLEALANIPKRDAEGTTDDSFAAEVDAFELRQSLRAWLAKGGFEPDWTANERTLFLWQSF